MKKNILIYIIIMILLIIGITIGTTKKEHKKEIKPTKKEETIVDKMKKIDFYNDKYKNRYQSYQKEYNNLSLEDIITRVNLSLDKAPYEDTKKTPYPNTDYILVNKHIYMGEDYIPENLEDLDPNYARSGMKLVKNAKRALEQMVKHAKNDGFTIRVMSSYRSYEYQVNLYNKYKETDGEEKADTYSARPGFSEHQTGLCIDIDDGNISYTNFEKSPSFNWMQENAHKYGFILRYPKNKTDITSYTYESWHYRYVGKDIASYIKKHDITFDEYYVRFIENKKR